MRLQVGHTSASIVGGIPFASVVPMRISETVVLTGLLSNTKEFADAIKEVLANPMTDRERLRERVENETWQAKNIELIEHLKNI